MKNLALVFALLLTACAGAPSDADTADFPIPPTAEMHPFLERLVGTWEHSSEIPDPSGNGEVMTMTSREVITGLGPWIASQHSAGGGVFEARMSLTWDEDEGAFIGTWIDSSSSYLWHYRGWLDEAGTTLTLESEGPAWEDPTQKQLYRDVTELVGDDRRIGRSMMQGADGEWIEFSLAEARRL